MRSLTLSCLIVWSLLVMACQPPAATAIPTGSAATASGLKVLAVESFLADIAQNVAGDRAQVETLIPIGVDPHSFEPTPGDVAKIYDSNVLIINGAGFEEWLQQTLDNAGGQRQVIEASAGLASRQPRPGEGAVAGEHGGDPHFWLDPSLVIKYVDNIRDALSQADPQGAPQYAQNAEAYTTELRALDQWITGQARQVPEARRKIVTNHESFGYFADRYGFDIVGTIIPSVSTDASPSARQLAQLVDDIKATGVPAIFLEAGTNPQLAEQVARETGTSVVTDLYSHSLTDASGPAPTYLDMMRHNTTAIVDALK